MTRAQFAIRRTWEEAIEKTDSGLIPVAARLHDIAPEPPEIDAEILEESGPLPCVLLTMTTVFSEKDRDGKLGYVRLPHTTQYALQNMLAHNKHVNEWVFLSQSYVSDETGNLNS
jgi:hypothetical protein